MDKVFLDTNVVVDFLCERGEFYLPAARIVTKAYHKEIELCYSPSLTSTFIDFEDAMQYFSAKQYGATIIITRNRKDFAASELPCYSPTEYLEGD